MMELTFNVDPLMVSLLAIGAPLAYKIGTSAMRRVDRRIRAIEVFLIERFGDPTGHFKPADE